MLGNKNAAYRDFLRQDYVNDILDKHINQGQNHRLMIWSFMCFEWWCKIFLYNEVPVRNDAYIQSEAI